MPETFSAPGQRIEVAIDKVVYGGEGLARTAEGVVLVPGLLPGERALVEAEAPRLGVRRGHLLKLLEASPERVAPECPYFGRCGGCQHQQAAYERQLQFKRGILRESLERVGRLRPDQLPETIRAVPSPPWQYRNRIRLQIEKSSASFQAGYLEACSHEICPVDCCPISSPALNEVLGRLSGGTGAGWFPEGACELELFSSDADRRLLATIYSREPAPPDFGNNWREAFPNFESVCWFQDPPGIETLSGSGALTYHVGEFHYRVSHRSFFQVNRFLLQELTGAVLADRSGARALDLYAGCGLLTLPLARRFERVAAVESQAPAARDLAVNAGAAGTRVHSYQKTAESFLAEASPPWDLIVADPPRAGLSKPVRGHLIRLGAPHLVYVSCDPTTLARDLAALTSSGYRLASLLLLDQFPQTFHIETVAHLERAG